MNIVMISENDPAGMAIAFCNAINNHTQHTCRLVTTKTRYNFNFPKDIHVPDLNKHGYEEIQQILRDADIFHFHILADENIELGPVSVRDFINGKTIVHHHHGHPHFRAHPELYRDKYGRLQRKVLVSTPDLLKLLPEATWQPNIVPIKDPLYMPGSMKKDGAVRIIGQSVTKRDLKDTEVLLHVFEEIQNGHHAPISLDVIENTDHKECLRRKNKCHIIFDHMQGYFGVSSLESLSQGKVVIAGLDRWNIKHITEYTGAESIPWQVCRDGKELKETLIDLIDTPHLMSTVGKRSRKFMCDYWSDKKIVSKLVRFYESL